MITLPNGKICMNEQEAISWLLDNYPIPFQCSANYAPDTEIGLGTIVNPTPAKVKVGSIIFFADSKVSTVIAVNANSFKCSEEYNDLVDDVIYVSNVQLNASGHLIVTLSNNTNIDAGLIKQVSGFSINELQHLIVSYNDGTTTDLGAIFTGNVNIAGNFTADSIIENMNGYSFLHGVGYTSDGVTIIYAGAVKNGNKLTLACFFSVELASASQGDLQIGQFEIPLDVDAKIYPFTLGGSTQFTGIEDSTLVGVGYAEIACVARSFKAQTRRISIAFLPKAQIPANTTYLGRYEITFLLSNNLAA